MHRRLVIENIDKIIGKDISPFHQVARMNKGLATYYIFVTEIATGNILEIKLERNSANDFRPYHWKMNYGLQMVKLFKSDIEDIDRFCRSLAELVDPLPF